MSAEAGGEQWPLAELPASIRHGQSPGSRLRDTVLGIWIFRAFAKFLLQLCSLLPGSCFQNVFHPDPYFQAMFFLLLTPCAAKLSILLHYTLSSADVSWREAKPPEPRFSLWLFLARCWRQHLCCQVSSLGSDVHHALPALKLRSLQVLSPSSCPLPHVLHRASCCPGKRKTDHLSDAGDKETWGSQSHSSALAPCHML